MAACDETMDVSYLTNKDHFRHVSDAGREPLVTAPRGKLTQTKAFARAIAESGAETASRGVRQRWDQLEEKRQLSQ